MGRNAHPPRPGFWSPVPRPLLLKADTVRPPRFLGHPKASAPCSPTPVGPPRQAFTALRCCHRLSDYGGSGVRITFEAQSHGSLASLSTLRSCGSPRLHARLGPGWWPTFAGQAPPAGCLGRFPLTLASPPFLAPLPPSPGFAWRTRISIADFRSSATGDPASLCNQQSAICNLQSTIRHSGSSEPLTLSLAPRHGAGRPPCPPSPGPPRRPRPRGPRQP